MITEKMFFSCFHGSLYKIKISSSNHVAYQSRLSLLKKESNTMDQLFFFFSNFFFLLPFIIMQLKGFDLLLNISYFS